jgi:hypothetical protein
MNKLLTISILMIALGAGIVEKALAAATIAPADARARAMHHPPSDRLVADPGYTVEGSGFFDNFDSYTAGMQLVVQNPTDWVTWSNLPGSGEDPYISNSEAYSGANSVLIVQNNDLVRVHGALTSGVWRTSWQMLIPAGQAGYFNTLAVFAGAGSNWAMQVYFNAGGDGYIDAGAPAAATFNYTQGSWIPCEVIVDLDNDVGKFILEGSEIHSWQWTLGAFGGGSPLQLDGTDLYGATAGDEMYVDDFELSEVVPNDFLDNFDTYTAGQQLVLQNNTDWDTWSSLPGSGEDPFVSNVHSYSGSNSVVIAQANDLIRLHNQRTTGSWGMSFQVYIPAGQAGYFNTMSGFTPNPFYWAMEVYFDAGGSGRLLTGDPDVNFTWVEDTWQLVEVIVDLDQDLAQFVFDGDVIHQWTWTSGASGGTGPLRLDANDFYGATAGDEMYFDDYHFMADSLRPTVDVKPGDQLPTEFAIEQNYPNPFNPTTTIGYALKERTNVVLKVYDLLGEEVRTLVNEEQSAGVREVVWDGRDNAGSLVSSGVYLYRIQAGNFVKAVKMILMK